MADDRACQIGDRGTICRPNSIRKDMLGIIDWRQAEIERLGVEVRLNAYAEAADVLAEAPEIVIIATGGVPESTGSRGRSIVRACGTRLVVRWPSDPS